MFPHAFSNLAWSDPVVINTTSGGTISNNESTVLSSIGLKHFVAYVLGAANDRRLSNSNTSMF